MKSLYWKRGVVSLGLVGVVTAQLLAAGRVQASDNPILNPSWLHQAIGHVNYSYRGDQRKGSELSEFRINEDGVVDGSEFFNLTHPGEFARFQQIMNAQASASHATMSGAEAHQQYRDYLQQLSDQGMSVLILNRIIDHEAMKRKFPVNVSEARVDYMARSILVQNAANLHRIDADKQFRYLDGHSDNIKIASNAGLFAVLKKAVGTNTLHFKADWDFDEFGMGSMREVIHTSSDIGWPMQPDSRTGQAHEQEVEMNFEKLPATWSAFRDEIRNTLQTTYRQHMRLLTWQRLVMERNPLLNWQTMFSVTTNQMDAAYSALRESFRVENLKADYSELTIQGAKASDFKARFTTVLDQRQEALTREIVGSDPNATTSAEEDARAAARIAVLRGSVPREVYNQVVVEFASDIAAGRLRLSMTDRSLTHSGLDALPASAADDQSFGAQSTRALFSPLFNMSKLFPRVDGVDTDSSIKILVLRTQTDMAPIYKKTNDPSVTPILRAKIEAKTRAKAFRLVALQLFTDNRFEYSSNLCSEAEWPCATQDPRKLTEALFPESLYPGKTLPSDGPGQAAISSTLGREGDRMPRNIVSLETESLFDRVFTISLDTFGRVLEVPNNHVDAGTYPR